MKTSALDDPNFRGRFSGHETFPLRYGWLNKVFDAVSETVGVNSKDIFSREDSIAKFGVGKNMVSSMKYWGLATGILQESEIGFQVSEFGRFLMGPRGVDRYLEAPSSLWLLHWNLASDPNRMTTWHWAFNCYSGLAFDQDQLVRGLTQLCQDKGWGRVSQTTLKRDVDCFVRSYSMGHRAAGSAVTEDTLEAPFCELNLIRSSGFRGGFAFQRGPKPDLSDAVFVFALDSFWHRRTDARTMSVETITFDPGSPGRVFKLDEESVIERLTAIEDSSQGAFRWTDVSGLKQVARISNNFRPGRFLRSALGPSSTSRRAA
jgi:hypothetical protein